MEKEFADRIHTKKIGKTVYFYECTDSTNLRAKLVTEHGALVVADRQTAGRGRRGRSWESPAGKNLYFTLALRPEIEPDKASMLTLVMAVAVMKGLQQLLKLSEEECRVGIKWPNDIVVDGKKICGILTEMTMQKHTIEQVLIGVGINVKEQEFAPELAEKATDLERAFGRALSRRDILGAVMEEFEEEYELFLMRKDLSALQAFYNAHLVNRFREVRVLDPQEEFCGVAEGINEKGELIVKKSDGSLVAVYAGEVSVRGIYGYI